MNTESDYQKRAPGYSEEKSRSAAWELGGKHAFGKILDIGSGNGEWAKRLAENSNVHSIASVDLVDRRIEQQGPFWRVDVAKERLPFGDGSIDWIFAIELLEHLENPRHLVREAFRILSPAGKFLITTPNCLSLTSRLSFFFKGRFPAFADHSYRETGHITPITELDMVRMAREAGFGGVQIAFLDSGRMPGTAKHWPLLKGKLWSDTMTAVLAKSSL